MTLEGIDVCPFAWMKSIDVSSSTFYRNVKFVAADHAAQNHSNMGLHKPKSHTVVATATLGAVFDRHVDQMPYKTCVLPSGKRLLRGFYLQISNGRTRFLLLMSTSLTTGCCYSQLQT